MPATLPSPSTGRPAQAGPNGPSTTGTTLLSAAGAVLPLDDEALLSDASSELHAGRVSARAAAATRLPRWRGLVTVKGLLVRCVRRALWPNRGSPPGRTGRRA